MCFVKRNVVRFGEHRHRDGAHIAAGDNPRCEDVETFERISSRATPLKGR